MKYDSILPNSFWLLGFHQIKILQHRKQKGCVYALLLIKFKNLTLLFHFIDSRKLDVNNSMCTHR